MITSNTVDMTSNLKEQWLHNGAPLTMESELIKIRKDIEQEGYPDKKRKVLLKAAYNEMRNRQGKVGRVMDCGSCMNQIMSQLKIWIGLYDNRTEIQKVRAKADIEFNLKQIELKGAKHKFANITEVRQMVKSKVVPNLPALTPEENKFENEDDEIVITDTTDLQRKYEAMEWNDILALLQTLPADAQKRLDEKKTRNFPKKKDIIEELIKMNNNGK